MKNFFVSAFFSFISVSFVVAQSNTFPATGNVGIGTTSPTDKLTINGALSIFGSGLDGSTFQRTVIYSNSTNGLLFEAPKNSSGARLNLEFNWRGGGSPPLFIKGSTSNVGIGTTNPDQRLTVNGKIKAEEVQVVVDVPADYVFDTSYPLAPLQEVETYIKANNHLPGMPDAATIKANGWAVGEMSNKLLEKVEELTLYLIELRKENEELKRRLEKIETKK